MKKVIGLLGIYFLLLLAATCGKTTKKMAETVRLRTTVSVGRKL